MVNNAGVDTAVNLSQSCDPGAVGKALGTNLKFFQKFQVQFQHTHFRSVFKISKFKIQIQKRSNIKSNNLQMRCIKEDQEEGTDSDDSEENFELKDNRRDSLILTPQELEKHRIKQLRYQQQRRGGEFFVHIVFVKFE